MPLPGHYEDLAVHLEYWRRRLLPEWDVYLMAKPADDNEGDIDQDKISALSQIPSPYNAVTFWLDPGLLEKAKRAEESWGYIEQVIVHEFLHALLEQIRDATDPLQPHVAPAAWVLFCEQRRLSEERAIDRIARALVAERRESSEKPEPPLRRGQLIAGVDWPD